MNKLFSLVLATTILAATPLMAMDEPEKGVCVKGVCFSSQLVKEKLQHEINRIIEIVSEDDAPSQLTPAKASGNAQTIENWSNFGIKYPLGRKEGLAFFLEGRQDAERLLSVAYSNSHQKCTLGELQSVKKGAKFSPNSDHYWYYWVEKDGKRVEECLKKEDRYCTEKANNHYPVFRYTVSEDPNQYLNFVVMPYSGSTEQVIQYETLEYTGQGQYSVTKSRTQDCSKSLEDTHKVDLIINGYDIPAGAAININGSQGYFDFTPKTSGRNDWYRLSF